MGKRGPKPTPTPILKLRGSWRGKDRPDADVEPNMPVMPKWMKPAAVKEWKSVLPDLDSLGVLQRVDATMIAMYCTDLVEFMAAYKECEELSTRFISIGREMGKDENGKDIVKKSGRVCKHPLFAFRDAAYVRLVKSCGELGLSPASRTGLAINLKQKSGKSKFFKGA